MFKYGIFDVSLLTNGFDDAQAVCGLGAVSIIQQPERRNTTGMIGFVVNSNNVQTWILRDISPIQAVTEF